MAWPAGSSIPRTTEGKAPRTPCPPSPRDGRRPPRALNNDEAKLIQTDGRGCSGPRPRQPTTGERKREVDPDKIVSGLHSLGKIQLSPFLRSCLSIQEIQTGHSHASHHLQFYVHVQEREREREPFSLDGDDDPWTRLPKLVLIQRSNLPALLCSSSS